MLALFLLGLAQDAAADRTYAPPPPRHHRYRPAQPHQSYHQQQAQKQRGVSFGGFLLVIKLAFALCLVPLVVYAAWTLVTDRWVNKRVRRWLGLPPARRHRMSVEPQPQQRHAAVSDAAADAAPEKEEEEDMDDDRKKKEQ